MSESKTILVGGQDANLTAMLPALLQKQGIDTGTVMGLINNANNRGGLLGNNGLGDIIALIIVASLFGNGNGNGLFGGNNNSRNAETDLLMQTLNRNGVDIAQIAQAVNCSKDQIIAGINQVAGSICNLGNQMGQNTNQIITAMLQGNNALTAQLASCCCDLKTIITQGFSSIGFETAKQTCAIEKAIAASTEAILAGQRNAEMREMQREITERDRRIAEQSTAINNYQQTQTFAAMLQQATAPLVAGIQKVQGDVDGIICKLPKTVTLPYSDAQAVPNCLYYNLFGLPFGNNGGGSFL